MPSTDTFLHLTNRHTGESLRLRRVRDDNGQVILEIEGSLPPHTSGPPAHTHWHQREETTVTAGTLGARCGGETLLVRAGQPAVFPAGVVHSWWNAGEDLLELNGQAIPAGDLDQFLQGVFAVVNAGRPGKPSLFYLAHVLWRHRESHVMALPPKSIQAVVFPLILIVGRMLGKYRGTNWPGAPESCTGSPESGG